jgi:hypothetical protein
VEQLAGFRLECMAGFVGVRGMQHGPRTRWRQMAVAAYWAAIQSRPKDKITLRQGARVVLKSWTE